MYISIDFNSDEAIYLQLCNQIIMQIATREIHEGENLPSVRELADRIGINMHTVNKAYSILRQEGYLTLDRRKGAVICLNPDKMKAMNELKRTLRVLMAQAVCKDISREEVHEIIDDIYEEWTK
ncbi:MAG: GntR family transcriptional regulator [Lachnospiraceae bacterium]|nr:GntR family transcriptional regulator [Lachnospiraceae bacterium]